MTNRTSGDRPSALARLWLPENDRNIPTSRTRAFLGRHLWLLCVIAVIVGFAAGLLSGLFVFKWNEWNSPSFGAFIAPAALLGWLALQPRQAALLGLLGSAVGVYGDSEQVLILKVGSGLGAGQTAVFDRRFCDYGLSERVGSTAPRSSCEPEPGSHSRSRNPCLMIHGSSL